MTPECQPFHVIEWNPSDIAHALQLPEEEISQCFTDARFGSTILERHIAHQIDGGSLPHSKCRSYDVKDGSQGRWEVRCISKRGTYFCRSSHVGMGRSLNRGNVEAASKWLEKLDGFFLADICTFRTIPIWKSAA